MNGSKLVLLFGILSVIVPVVGVFLGMVAIGLGIKTNITANGNGRTQRRIGMILGLLSVVLTIVGLFFFLPLYITM